MCVGGKGGGVVEVKGNSWEIMFNEEGNNVIFFVFCRLDKEIGIIFYYSTCSVFYIGYMV